MSAPTTRPVRQLGLVSSQHIRRPSTACYKCSTQLMLAKIPPSKGHAALPMSAITRRAAHGPGDAEPVHRESGGGDDPAANSQPEEQGTAGVRAALSALRFYKSAISPILPQSCRFLPTCSSYAMDAYEKYGVGRGTLLTAWRLVRCNPWGPSGYDPVKWPPPGLEWLEAET